MKRGYIQYVPLSCTIVTETKTCLQEHFSHILECTWPAVQEKLSSPIIHFPQKNLQYAVRSPKCKIKDIRSMPQRYLKKENIFYFTHCNTEDRVTDVKHWIVEMLGREGQDANVDLYRPAV